jgi:hypothetical protein
LPPKSDPMPAFDAEPEDHPVTLQLWDVASSRRPNPLTSARPRPAARA